MPLHKTHRFFDGRLVKAEPPEWFKKAIATDDSSQSEQLRKAGATAVDEFGDGGDTLEIWEGPDGDYYIDYWDSNKCVAEIFIDNIADYFCSGQPTLRPSPV